MTTSPRLLLALLLFPLATIVHASGDVEADWQAVMALEAGPKQAADIRTREQARTVALEHLVKQEASLSSFLRNHPTSPHTVDAQLQMARLYATWSDLSGSAAYFDSALRILNDALATAPKERRADFVFAKIALNMRRMSAPTEQNRAMLTAQMNAFRTSYPDDRRVAGLLTEVATLFDDQPRRKQELLNQALASAPSPELRARIDDDLKRVGFLGHPIEVQGTTPNGTTVDLAQFRGKVTLVYFFASWSLPSLAGIAEVETLRKTFIDEPVEVIGVSLDATPDALQTALKARNIAWPVIFDGKSWKSPLVRSLCINALPTLWLIDRQGNLRTLNTRTESEALVRTLLKEKKS